MSKIQNSAVRLATGPLLLITTLFCTSPCQSGDWPQILGPSRNGEADQEPLAATWPATGPQQAWTHEIGEGYGGPASAGDAVVIFHRQQGKERLESLDLKTGRRTWVADLPARYTGGIDSDKGPRSVPVIHKDSVFVFGAAGDLHCVALATGKVRWSREAASEMGADLGYFGAGSSPVVIGNQLLVNVGGRRDGAGIVAFQIETGKTTWKSVADDASYSSPAVCQIAGKPTAIFVTRLNCVAVDPETGKVRFTFPFGKRGPTVNAATPLVFGDNLFLTASYGVGALLAKITDSSVTPVWSNDDVMSSQYSTPVHRDGFLYGVHGREDIGVGDLRCIEAKTGKIQWSEDGFGVANLILSGDKLLILKTNGQLVLARASSEKFQSLATAQVAKGTTRALPALAHGHLVFRTNEGAASKLISVRVGAK